MNLEESNSFMEQEEKKEKKKKIVIAFIILCLVLIVIIIGLIALIQYQDAQTLKMFINGTQVNISSTLYKSINDKTYVNVEEFGEMLGYHYTQGEYNKYNEDESSCYLTNIFEIITLTAEEKIFTKYAQFIESEAFIANIPVTIKSQPGQAQKYTLDNDIKLVDGVIYVPFEETIDMFNIQIDLSNEKRIRVYSLDAIVANAQNVISRLNYTSMSGDYENLKAMIYGIAVVGDGSNFGVVSLENGKEIIGIKYKDMTFIQNSQDFLIKTDNTVGIYSANGSVVIKPTEYDEISVYDDVNQLYLVKKDGKYGILNRVGEVIIYPDYDKIGYEFSESSSKKTEYNLIFDKCIPVKENGKYGLYSIDGKELLRCAYDTLGSVYIQENNSDEKPILEIPVELGIKGIIINQGGLYGLYDVETERIIIPIACTKAYSTTRSAQTTYYVEHAGVQYNLDEYLEINNLKSINTEGNLNDDDETSENTNTVENDVTEETEE